MKMIKFHDLSIRARVAYGAKALELLLDKVGIKWKENEDWEFVMDKIWSYTNSNVGEWHNYMAELTPFSVEEDLPFEEKGYECFEKEIHDKLIEIYKFCPLDLKKLIELIFEIGTLDLYSSVTNGSPRTVAMLIQIEEILEENGINKLDLNPFAKFSIEEEDGWGRAFERMEVLV